MGRFCPSPWLFVCSSAFFNQLDEGIQQDTVGEPRKSHLLGDFPLVGPVGAFYNKLLNGFRAKPIEVNLDP